MIQSILKFWKIQRERGNKPQPVYAVVSEGGQQPVGYMVYWSVHKSSALSEADRRSNAGLWSIVRMQPA